MVGCQGTKLTMEGKIVLLKKIVVGREKLCSLK